MKKILLVTHNQFGYQTKMYRYAQYFCREFAVDYFCLDYGRKKVSDKNIKVIYIEKEGTTLKQLFRFLHELRVFLKNNDYDMVIIKYLPFCSLIKFSTKNILLSIATRSVSASVIIRIILNSLLRLESKLFNNIIVESEGLRKVLGLSRKKTAVIIPQGGEAFCAENYTYDEIKLIYIGTLDNRKIDRTIWGVRKFLEQNQMDVPLTYTIIGFGSSQEESKLNSLIHELELENIVRFMGLVQYDELGSYIKECNVGVSFIPITPYFNVQTPIKTIEYLLSGLPVIATSTIENMKLINKHNGVLINDTSCDFCRGIKSIILHTYDNRQIRESMTDYTWEKIFINKLGPLINKIMKSGHNAREN